MPEYLSKEEVKRWRSSLEKITLEEYATRLGKVIEEEKQTNDLVDILLKGNPVISKIDSPSITKGEKISSIAQRAFDRERTISDTPFSVSVGNKTKEKKEVAQVKPEKKEVVAEVQIQAKAEISLKETVNLTFAKALTDREQLVFDYFMNNQNKIVYAKDLATLLSLPRDYVYKYIKNLRAKIEGDKLQNSENGGYILSI